MTDTMDQNQAHNPFPDFHHDRLKAFEGRIAALEQAVHVALDGRDQLIALIEARRETDVAAFKHLASRADLLAAAKEAVRLVDPEPIEAADYSVCLANLKAAIARAESATSDRFDDDGQFGVGA